MSLITPSIARLDAAELPPVPPSCDEPKSQAGRNNDMSGRSELKCKVEVLGEVPKQSRDELEPLAAQRGVDRVWFNFVGQAGAICYVSAAIKCRDHVAMCSDFR